MNKHVTKALVDTLEEMWRQETSKATQCFNQAEAALQPANTSNLEDFQRALVEFQGHFGDGSIHKGRAEGFQVTRDAILLVTGL